MAATRKTKPKTKTKGKAKTGAKKKSNRAAPKKSKPAAKRKTSAKTPKSKSSKAKPRPKTKAKAKTSRAKPKQGAKTKSSTKVKAKKTVKSKAKSGAPPKKAASKSKTKSTAKTPAKQAERTPAEAPTPARGKSVSRQFLVDLADHIRQAVLPAVKAAKGREIVGTAASGDPTFKIDSIAEKALLAYLKEAKEPVAYYSEDQGYTTFTSGQPQALLVIDPIDGTRAAKSGFEACVVAVACTRVIERPRMADVDSALVMEILGDRTFYAERGKGTRIYQDGQPRKPRPSTNKSLELMSWSMTVTARPAELIFPTAAKLIDLTSLKGGFFACNSTSYSLTRLLTNQLDACVDFANRYLRDIPASVEDHFINAGRGAVIGIAPYDIAASLLVAEEAGCVVTDAYGNSFDDVMLLDTSATNLRSMIAASNKELHGLLMTFFDTRIRQFEQLLKRRTQAGG